MTWYEKWQKSNKENPFTLFDPGTFIRLGPNDPEASLLLGFKVPLLERRAKACQIPRLIFKDLFLGLVTNDGR